VTLTVHENKWRESGSSWGKPNFPNIVKKKASGIYSIIKKNK
jgi:hypothetical protein